MPTDTGATSVNGAAKRLSGLLEPEQSLPTEENETEEQEAQAQEHEATQETEEESLETQEAEVDAEADSDTEVESKQDEGEEEVDEQERERGYLRDKDYRQKTMALADERKAVEAKAQELDKQLEDAQAVVDDQMAYLQSDAMQELRQDDPDQYLKEVEKAQSKAKKLEDIRAKRKADHEARKQKQIEDEREALLMAFPEWREDTEAAQREFPKLMNELKEFGFTDDELQNLTDHRLFVIADKLKKLNELESVNLESKKVKPKPKSAKPGTGTTKQDRLSAEAKAKRERLKKTGNIRDAVALLRN